jgi:hypothetical protein
MTPITPDGEADGGQDEHRSQAQSEEDGFYEPMDLKLELDRAQGALGGRVHLPILCLVVQQGRQPVAHRGIEAAL